MNPKKLFLLLELFLLATAAAAQDTPASPPVKPPTVRAYAIDEGPRLDGEVLADPVWQAIEPVTEFWQTTPDEGKPVSESTAVRLAFTATHLYVGVLCFDRNPEMIIVSDTRRDSSLTETDSFQVILDTYEDRQSGFVFGTNPAGVEYDAQVTNEGQGGSNRSRRQSGGAGGGFNINWDASWEVRTRTGSFGWSAEFAIPFRTLRYKLGEDQIWGVNFQRNIRRRNESAFWAPLPRQFNLYRLSLAGNLVGLDIPRQNNLQMTPYVLGRTTQREGDTTWTGDVGGDLKYNLSPSLTLDGTYNTDFAQVEVDDFQINLDRFNLFFPEKRPFFLENAGFFAVGDPGEVELFFSRRIGIGREGSVIPILGGGRLSGKLTDSLNIGVLSMQTKGIEGVEPSNNFSVVRLSRELPNRSSVGGIFVNRQGTGDFAASEDYNRSYAFDGAWGVGEFTEFSGFAAKTSSPGLEGEDHAFKFGGAYDSEGWRLSANYTEVGMNFNPEVGFLRRDGFRKADWLVYYRYRPEDFLGLHELRPHISSQSYWNFEGFQETGYIHVDNHWEWKSGAEIHTGINFTREGVVHPFEIYPGVIVPPGTYDHQEAQIVAFTNRGAPISAGIDIYAGGFFGGDRLELEPTANLRLGERFNTEFSWSRNDIELPGGAFITNLARARVSYSFSPRIFVQSLLQYNDRAEIWSANLRFGWLQAANTGFFIVYNDTRGLENSFLPGERSLIIKYSRLIHFFD